MMVRLPFVALIATTAALSAASVADAGGLIQRIPKDGSWVKYYMDMKSDGPRKQEMNATMTLRAVGSVTENGEKCRWVELQMQGEENGKKRNMIMKFLIREKELKPGAKTTPRIIRGWKKQDDKAVTEISDREKADQTGIAIFFGGAKDAKTVKEAKTIDYQKGQLKIASATRGKPAFNVPGDNAPPGLKYDATQTVWTHKDVPFGTAALEMTMKISFKGNPGSTMKMTFTVQDHGTGAKSALPDKK